MSTPRAFPLKPVPIHVSDEVLDDLRARLTSTRPPLDEGNGDCTSRAATTSSSSSPTGCRARSTSRACPPATGARI
ncbi:hypothetical protein E1294_41830 [Nonomuraea diastatica]|uniref:Uncharacterized protein n=1 Tax=Nonomuraea diastatica TaxID=1848329 RepID=A0A4R4WI08_9ACTN|nr:hypothetical protein E1294_41830 [Nonomuraea diastatica]